MGSSFDSFGQTKSETSPANSDIALKNALTSVGISGRTPESAEDNSITVRIHDYAHVSPSVLRRSELIASNAFREVRVNVSWVDCPMRSATTESVCNSPVTPLVLLLNLLPESMSQHFQLQTDAFGVAAETTDERPSFFGSVFYERVKDCATRQRIDLAPFLGSVMAHELGHLLLGNHSHSATGLMRGAWSLKELNVAERSGLSFTGSEASRLQSAMKARSQTDLSKSGPSESVVEGLRETKSPM